MPLYIIPEISFDELMKQIVGSEHVTDGDLSEITH
jgi:hypothetical protein